MAKDAVGSPCDVIGLSDPDAPIYRIFPLWCLEESLRLRRITLVQPRAWEDPFEIIGEAIAVSQWSAGQVIINQDLPPAFAQCWSATSESDTLQRAYSRVDKDPRFKRNTCPRYEGVQVKSTARKLLQALCAQPPSVGIGHAYAGAVRYLNHDKILQRIANTIAAYGLDAFRVPRNRADLLLLKRPAFEHEGEVRLLYVCNEESSETLLHVPVDPNDVFDEIRFDPRLEPFEFRERESVIRSLGYHGTVGQSELYHRTLLQVVLEGAPAKEATS